MFGLFKSRTDTKDPLAALIERQTAFSVNGVSLHKNLVAAASNPEAAVIEAFLFNNWTSYHLIADELRSTLSDSAPLSAHQSLQETIRLAIVNSARDIGVKDLERKFSARVSAYCKDGFYLYAERTLIAYDDSVARHSTGDWQSAAIALHANCGLAHFATSDFEYYQKHFLKETVQIYLAMEEAVRKDAKQYVRNRR
jgi:hypothetical protein